MTVFTEEPRAGAYIADEVSVNLSRKQGVIASGSGRVPAGHVLAVSGDKYVPFDGSNTAAAILFDTVDATDADADCVVSATLTAVNESEIVWPEGVTDAQKATATAALEAVGITVLAADIITPGS